MIFSECWGLKPTAYIDKPKDTDTALFQLYSLFLNKLEIEKLTERFITPGMRYGDIKQELYDCFWTQFSPYREKRDYLEKHKDHVIKKLNEVGYDFMYYNHVSSVRSKRDK